MAGYLLGIATVLCGATAVNAAAIVPSAAAASAVFLLSGIAVSSANEILDALDRPQAAHKINIYGHRGGA